MGKELYDLVVWQVEIGFDFFDSAVNLVHSRVQLALDVELNFWVILVVL